MKILLPHVLIMDPRSPHHGQTVDLLLEDGSIVAIGDTLDARGATVLESAPHGGAATQSLLQPVPS